MNSWSVFVSLPQMNQGVLGILMTNCQVALAPHSSTLAWKIPWTEEPGGLQSMGSLRVGHDCATSLSLFTFMHRRRKWQPTPVFLPGESQGRRSLVGCCLWGRTELNTTEGTQQRQQQCDTQLAISLTFAYCFLITLHISCKKPQKSGRYKILYL